MKPTLLILAAGLGARYGGLKQIDPVGPNGEILIDYSIYDAVNAGFGKLVFVIRHYFENAFREKIGSKFNNLAETAYAYQEIDACLDGFEPPKDRDKPWGTGHAVLVAGDLIDGPFAVINADDYYGPDSFKTMAQFLTQHQSPDLLGGKPRRYPLPSARHSFIDRRKIGAGSPNDYAMVGYTLRDTLSEYGSVSRGVCQCDERMYLRRVVERKKVEKTAAGARYFDDDGTEHPLSGDEVVSMNLWGFQPSIFRHLESHLSRFLKERGGEKNAELYIPTVVDDLIERGKATVKVLRTNDVWFGVTYRRDAAIAAGCIRRLIDQGLYPENLSGATVKRRIESIARQFCISGRLVEARPLPRGHINDTYILTARQNKHTVRYILQRINHTIFKDPSSVMENIIRVTGHIRARTQETDPGRASRQLTVIQSNDGNGFYRDRDAEGSFWRAYNFIEGAVTYDTVESPEPAYEAARMFGWFQNMLIDLPGPTLHETICDFHNTPRRFETFRQVLEEDVCNRAKDAKSEIEFLFDNAEICSVLLNLAGEGKIPVRVAHNDAKINNVMLDKATNKGVCVIDLDTVMPGLSIYDFGDLVRTAATSADEDERDLSKVAVDFSMFEALVRGYSEQAKSFLTSVEKKHLVFAAKLITFEQFIRFLTDYLAGDVYYKVQRAGHNLDRSRTQMKLVQSIMEHEEAMNKVVQRVFEPASGGIDVNMR